MKEQKKHPVSTALWRLFAPLVTNRFLLFTLSVCSKFSRKRKDVIKANRFWNEHREPPFGAYIEDQNALTDLKYGKEKIARSGCEILAVYNVLLDAHQRDPEKRKAPVLSELITAFEHDGMIFSGAFGTHPLALKRYLGSLGFTVRESTKEEEFDALFAESGSSILTFYNDKRDIWREIHTVALTKEGDACFAHNVYGDGRILPFFTVSGLLQGLTDGESKGILLLVIDSQEEN